MNLTLILMNWLLPILYVGLLIDYGAAFFLRTKTHGRSHYLGIVVALHLAFLIMLASYLGRLVPGNNCEVLSVLAAATAVVYLFVEGLSKDRRSGVFVLLVVFLMQYSASVFLPPTDLYAGRPEAAQDYWARFHILPAIVAYTGFTISAIYGALYLLARRDLKGRQFGLLFDRLPPLDLLGTMMWHAMLLGFVFMTLSILSGSLLSWSAPSQAHLETRTLVKIFVGSAAWLVYAAAVSGRLIGRWEARRVSVLSLIGFAVVVAMLVGVIVVS